MIRIVAYSLIAITLLIQQQANCAELSKWQKYLEEGRSAIKANDPSYAVYKLRLAWNSVPNKNTQAYQELRTVLIQALAQNGENLDDSIEDLDHRVKQREKNAVVGGFAVELAKDGSLNLFADDALYSPTAGYCGTGSLESTETEKLAEAAKAQADKQKLLLAKMPLQIKPGTDKYRELMALCKPLKQGERKEIHFDLNPFLPREFQTSEDL